jgi:drug/metabolite transporter (DMT)-like permease
VNRAAEVERTDSSVRSRFWSGVAMVVVAACMWGSWPLILRFTSRGKEMPAAVQTSIMMTTLTFVCFALVPFDRVKKKATRADWVGVAWLGAGDALNALCLFYAYKVASVPVAVLTHDMGPLLVALAAPLALKERVRASTFVAIALSLLGLSLMLRPWEVSATRGELWGAFFGLASAFFYASNVVMNKRLTGAFSGSELMAWHGVFALPVLVAMSIYGGGWSQVSAGSVALMAVLSIGPGAFGGVLFAWGVRRMKASLAATIALLEPVVAIILSVLVLGEHLSALGATGVLLVLGAAYVVARAPEESSQEETK